MTQGIFEAPPAILLFPMPGTAAQVLLTRARLKVEPARQGQIEKRNTFAFHCLSKSVYINSQTAPTSISSVTVGEGYDIQWSYDSKDPSKKENKEKKKEKKPLRLKNKCTLPPQNQLKY